MKRTSVTNTTMVLVLTIFLASTLAGCGDKTPAPEPIVSTEAVTETEETGYKDIEVEKEYGAVLLKDATLTASPDSTESLLDLKKDVYVTVFAEVEFNGVSVDFYHVRTEDGKKGYIDGRNLDFTPASETDYADTIEEATDGDGTEDVASVVDTSEGQAVAECEPVTRYTNVPKANVRASADKAGMLVDSVSLNTEVVVTGTTETGWSETERNGVVCFIKSSLLSDAKTAVAKPAEPKPADTAVSKPAETPPATANNSGTTGVGDDMLSLPEGFFDDMQTIDDLKVTGTTGSDGSGGIGAIVE